MSPFLPQQAKPTLTDVRTPCTLIARHGIGHAVGHATGDRLIRVRHDGEELVATRAGQEVATAQDAGGGARHGDEDFVPDLVAMRIVDRLEVVDIQDEDAHRLRSADLH